MIRPSDPAAERRAAVPRAYSGESGQPFRSKVDSNRSEATLR